jgi:hypothetical protein
MNLFFFVVPFVVPANAGTHNPWRLWKTKGR